MYYMYLSQQKGRPFQFRILKSLIILILKVKGSLLNYVATKLNIYGNLDSLSKQGFQFTDCLNQETLIIQLHVIIVTSNKICLSGKNRVTEYKCDACTVMDQLFSSNFQWGLRHHRFCVILLKFIPVYLGECQQETILIFYLQQSLKSSLESNNLPKKNNKMIIELDSI